MDSPYVIWRWPMPVPNVAVRHSLSVGEQQQLGGVVEDDADGLVAQLVAETVLVRVVDPLAEPQERHRRRVLRLIWSAHRPGQTELTPFQSHRAHTISVRQSSHSPAQTELTHSSHHPGQTAHTVPVR